MDVPFEGGCACGAIRYRCSAPPYRVYHCHCTDCQKATGTAFHTGVMVPREAVVFTKGAPKTWDREADSGNTITEAFCADCGGPLYVCSNGRPTHLSLKAGSLDHPEQLAPTGQIWLSSAMPWHDTCLATDKHERGYVMGPVEGR